MNQPSPLSDQVAIVTGASRGIGAAIARKLASLGAHVVLAARDKEQLNKIVAEINAAGGHAESHACDLTQPDQIEVFAQLVLRTHGRCDILVNNAGVGWLAGPAARNAAGCLGQSVCVEPAGAVPDAASVRACDDCGQARTHHQHLFPRQ